MQSLITRVTRSLLAAGALVLAGACGGDDEQPAPARDTLAARAMDSVEVLSYLAALDQGEVQTAQVGTRRATSTEVRQFAQLLWREHAKSGRDVAELARQMNVDLRAAAPSSPMIANLRTTSQQTTQQLINMPRGTEFDRAYVASQVRAHQALLQDLRRVTGATGPRMSASLAPGGGVDVGITGIPDTAAMAAAAARAANRTPETAREAAQMMLARVQQHLERARQLQARLGATASPAPPTTAPAPRRPGGARP